MVTIFLSSELEPVNWHSLSSDWNVSFLLIQQTMCLLNLSHKDGNGSPFQNVVFIFGIADSV